MVTARRMTREQLEQAVARAATLTKQFAAGPNNAAWLVALDALDRLRTLPRWNGTVKGGGTPCGKFKRASRAFREYELGLVYGTAGFFSVKDIPDGQRRFYGRISDREYYDFWAATGNATYSRTLPLVTSLQNKYRLALLHGGIAEAEAAPVSWGMCAAACLNISVHVYNTALDVEADTLGIPRHLLDKCFRPFSLAGVAKLWEEAARALSPQAYGVPLSATDDGNIRVGMEQLSASWTDGNSLYDDIEATLRDCGEDVMKTQGFIKKAIGDIERMRKFHNQN